MVKVYSTPDKEIPLPKPDYSKYDREKEQAAEDKYKADLVKYLNEKGFKEPETGYILKFQVGDGYAEYMVVSVTKPAVLHITLGDAWEYGINRFSKKGFADEIKAQKNWEAAVERMTKKQ